MNTNIADHGMENDLNSTYCIDCKCRITAGRCKHGISRDHARMNRITNDWAMYGAATLITRLKSAWILADICQHPGRFATKAEARQALTNLILGWQP